MSRSRIVFLLIIAVAIGLVVAGQVIQRLPTPPTPTSRPPLAVEVAVNPLAYDWISEQATAFNKQNVQVEGQVIQVTVTARDSIDVWRGSIWSSFSHPTAWIPEASFVLDYAADNGIKYETLTPSVASTALVWGIFADRAKALGPSPDWDSIQQAAVKGSWKDLGGQESWGFVKLAFPLPQKSTQGFAVLLSAAASYSKKGQITSQMTADSQFQSWFKPMIDAVPSFTTLGQMPAATLASRGSSVADFALLPESEWLLYLDRIKSREPLQFAYPAYNVIFDMPLAIWSGAETTAGDRLAVRQFADFLVQVNPQKAAARFGLRPAKVNLSETDLTLFQAGVAAGLTLDAVPGNPISVPPHSSALGLLSWFQTLSNS